MHNLIKKVSVYMKQLDDIKKRELPPLGICAILFLCAFFFSIIILDNSYEAQRLYSVMLIGEGVYGSDSQSPGDAGLLVVIDPGHGGNDPGKVSPDGILEKDINLEISFVLKAELERRGITTHMLRITDENLATKGATNRKTSDMKNRVAIINDTNPDVFVSIHQNSFTDPSVRGPQVFYHSASEASEEFALVLQEKLKALNSDYAREAKQGNDYYILNKTVCPGVIVECGFLSCPEEAAILTSQEYQQKIASAIADAIEDAY